jgi:cytoskeletal protein CcmA (bactofilin family)
MNVPIRKPVTEICPHEFSYWAIPGFQRRREGLVVVGKGASIVGDITSCSQVEIAGTFEGTVVAEDVIVRPGGYLKGTVSSERAEVHGRVEGRIRVEHHLDIRSTGRVSGELSYGRLSVASGGLVAGTIELSADGEPRLLASEAQTAALAVPKLDGFEQSANSAPEIDAEFTEAEDGEPIGSDQSGDGDRPEAAAGSTAAAG